MKVEELAEKLMSYRTVSPVTDPDVFIFIKGILEKRGIEAEVVESNGVYNLVAETGDGDTVICFNGHLDVVEPEGEWEVTEPFEPRVQDGRLYGRGAADMKGAFAAQMKAFMELHQDPDFEGRAVLMAVGDEEVGGFNGTAALLEDYMNETDFDYAVVGEATDLDIQVGTRGVLWVDVELEGDGIHATRSGLAERNIPDELPEVLERLEELEMSHEEPSILPEPSSEVTLVETTDTYNSIPGSATIGMDIRYLPGQKPDQIIEDIRNCLDGVKLDFDVSVNTDHGGDFRLEDEEFREISTEVVKKVTGDEPEHITEGGASDGRFFAAHGTPFIELGTVQETVHGEDENCRLNNLKDLLEMYRGIALELAEKS